MKHYYSFLIITSLLLAGCGQKDRAKSQFESSVQTEESYPLAKEYIKEAVITGKVLNRDFYPQEKELTLIIPFFWKMENQYRTPIQEDGSFSFRFPVYAKLREVSIRNYAEHLYIHPGDSIHVEIDFKDLFHPKVTGDAEKLNQEILAFTESGRTTVRLFNAKNVSITTIASSVLSGVYSIIVSTVNGCPDFLTITVSIIPIIQIAITGIIFLNFFILYHLSHQRYL